MNYLLNYGLSTNEIEAIEKNNMTLLGIAIEEQENVIKNIEYFKSLEININFYILNRFLSLFTQDNEEIIKDPEKEDTTNNNDKETKRENPMLWLLDKIIKFIIKIFKRRNN